MGRLRVKINKAAKERRAAPAAAATKKKGKKPKAAGAKEQRKPEWKQKDAQTGKPAGAKTEKAK